MHKKLKHLIVASILTTFLILPYVVNAKGIEPNHSNEQQITQTLNKDNFIFLKGNLGHLNNLDIDGIADFFNENKDFFKLPNPKYNLKIMSIKNDELNNTHIKLHQLYDNVEIFNNELIIHINDKGDVIAVNGTLDITIYKTSIHNLTFIKKIDSNTAIDIAKKELCSIKLSNNPKTTKYIYEINGQYLPVFEVNLSSIYPNILDYTIYINSLTGDIIYKIDRSEKLDDDIEQVEGLGVLGDKKIINVLSDFGSYALIDTTPDGVNIFTHDGSKISAKPESNDIQMFLPGDIYFKSTNKFDEAKDKSAVDAHFYARFVYDYYKTKFNRNSIDNKGKNIMSTVHLGKNWCNAMWACGQMIYGDGDGKTVLPLSGALDLVAHEITHGVQESECKLNYSGQSGALNESFSDVFGTLIESEYKKDNANYMIGEDVWKAGQVHGIRDMESPDNPKLTKPQAAHMNQYKDMPKSTDNGGVHYNSGIPNRAAYLIMKSIGNEKTAKIYYHTICSNLPSNADFHQARLSILLSTSMLYGESSPEYKAVSVAFDTVGIR